MPVTPQVPINGNRIIQIHGEHSSRCPAIQQPSIWRITSVRIPNWCKMRSPLIGTVTIFLKLMGHIIADIHPLQKPPKPLILKFRKISHRILRRRDRTKCHTDLAHSASLPAPAYAGPGDPAQNHTNFCRILPQNTKHRERCRAPGAGSFYKDVRPAAR